MTTSESLKIHPAAAIFPMMSDPELRELADDIKEHGLLHPIALDATGEILIDGRNRLKACEMAGVKPEFIRLNGEDHAAYILSANVERRSLSQGQKAIARAIISPEAAKLKRKGVDVENFNIDRAMLSHARLIRRHLGESVALLILAGAKPFDVALQEATEKRDRQIADEERMAKLRNDAPDLAELVADGKVTLDEAVAAFNERKRKADEAERNRRETFIRVLEEAYRGIMGLANEEFVSAVRELIAEDEGFKRTLKQRMRLNFGPAKDIMRGADALFNVVEDMGESS